MFKIINKRKKLIRYKRLFLCVVRVINKELLSEIIKIYQLEKIIMTIYSKYRYKSLKFFTIQ